MKINRDLLYHIDALTDTEKTDLVRTLLEIKVLLGWLDIIRFMEDVFKYKPSESQKEFLLDFSAMENGKFKYKKHLITGGRGGGKTLIASVAGLWSVTILPLILGREYRVIIMGGSERQARKAYSYIVKAIERVPLISSFVIDRPYREKTRFVRGELIILPASQKAARHEHVDMLLIDEAALVDGDVFKAALPIIGESEYPKLVITSTPGPIPSLIFNDMLMNPESWGIDKVYRFSAVDAPWKDKTELQIFKEKLSPDEFKREFEGEVVLKTDHAFDYTQWAKYGMEKVPIYPHSPSYMAVDWGFGEYPSAVVVAQVRDGIFYIITAHYLWGQPDSILDRLEGYYHRYNVKAIYADASHPSENKRLIERGMKVIPINASHRKMSMIYRLKNYLEGGRIRFPIHYKEMLKEFSTYYWEEDGDKIIPRVKHDHIVDALSILLEGYHTKEDVERIAYVIRY